MSKKTGNYIGGARGSGSINTTSLAHNRAAGGPAAGYIFAKGYGAQGTPVPEKGALNCEPARKAAPTTGSPGPSTSPKVGLKNTRP
jgi:hypothetical protein